MKPLTIIKSILTSPLFKKSIALGFLLWIIFAIPSYVLTWHYLVDNEVHKNTEQRIANEIILANIFESQARFGDAVNARGFIIEKAKPLGLLNLLICDGSQPILATLSTEKCPTHNNFVPVLISGKNLHLFFVWQDVKLSNAKILGAALSVSLLIVSFLVFSVAISMYLLTRSSLKDFSDKLFNLAATDGIPDFPSFPEVTPIVDALKSLKNKLYDFQQKEIDMLIAKKTSDIAKQVSHDIRSPLAALNMVIGDLDQVAEDKRILIRNSVNRINDIANTLLTKSKNAGNESGQNERMTIELIPSLVDSIVSEKRVQYRDKIGITIEADLRHSYGAFALVNTADLKRVISNLINNSVEAAQLDSATVTVAVRIDENKVKLTIKDNGKGIPSSILSKLGQTTISYGKEHADNYSGSGLGIFHAKKSIESSHGEMNIESTEGVGTTISISFPRAKTPEWFVEKIIIRKQQKVIIIDDDVTIHQAWQGRLDQQAELVKFSSAIEFENWFNLEKNQQVEDILFLFDYELGKLAITGLDLIEKYQLQNQSILVTSRYEEPAIRARAEHLKLKIIPKGMVGFVAIELVNRETPTINDLYTRCLIDDDALVRMTWEWAAKKDNIKLLTCDSLKSFEDQIAKVNFETEIYIDVHLAEDVKGQAVASTLHNQGFKKLYFATGYDASALTDVPDYILGVTGKDPVRNS